jgi:hypothetical protein
MTIIYVIQKKKNNLHTLPVTMVVIGVIVMQGIAAVKKDESGYK